MLIAIAVVYIFEGFPNDYGLAKKDEYNLTE